MFLPIGDSPNFRSTPWVTYSLIAVNVLVFLWMLPMKVQRADPSDPATWAYQRVLAEEAGVRAAQISRYDVTVYSHGFKPGRPELSDVLTSMFMHGGWLHLLGNMLFLWIYGDNVEHRLGRIGYLLAYLGAGVAAVMGDALLRAGSGVPSVGASGAISGVLGFYFIWFPRNTVRVWVFLFPFFANIIELPARLVLGFYLVVDNLLPAILVGSSSGVAYGAHLGGFFAAMALALVINRAGLRRPEKAVRSQRAATPGKGWQDELRKAIDIGDLGGAASLVTQVPVSISASGIDSALIVRLGEQLAAAGHPRAALAVLHRVLAEQSRGPAAAAAHLGTARVLLNQMGMPAEAYQHLVRAYECGPSAGTRAELGELYRRLATQGVIPRRWGGS